MKKRLFLMLSVITSQIFANDLVCPYGCGSSTDPAVGDVGRVLLESLEKIDFLKKTTIINSNDGDNNELYEQELDGETWQLIYEASFDHYIEDIEEDDDEFQTEIEEYHFSREKTREDIHAHDIFETNLSNYLETSTFFQTIFNDLHFCSNDAQRERLTNIEEYYRKIAQEPSQEKKQHYRSCIDSEQRNLHREMLEYSMHVNVITSAQARAADIYRNIFDECIHKHNWFGSFYCRGLLNFQKGYFIDAFDDVSKYLKSANQKEDKIIFPEELFLYKGLLESEMGIYNAAIESLSKVIEANPGNNEAYFERAAAYFELGRFDLCLEDYLASGIKPSAITSDSLDMVSFSLGMTKGILSGGAQAGIEFVPSILSSLQGIGHGLWVFG